MVYSSKKMELIEKYFNEELSDVELEFFKEELSRDKKFAEEVKQYEYVFGGLKEARVRKLKDKFKTFEHEIQIEEAQQKSNKNVNRLGVGLVSIISIILVSFSYYYFKSSVGVKSEQIFAEYFTPYPNVVAPITRSADGVKRDVFIAMNYYDSMRYDEAIVEFDRLIEREEYKNEMLFYKAVALLAKGHSPEALMSFKLIEQTSEFENQKKWYLALTYLDLGDLNQAKLVLDEIITDKSYFMIEAEELLNTYFPKEE